MEMVQKWVTDKNCLKLCRAKDSKEFQDSQCYYRMGPPFCNSTYILRILEWSKKVGFLNGGTYRDIFRC